MFNLCAWAGRALMYQLNKSESVRRADAFKITAQRKSPIIRAQSRAPPRHSIATVTAGLLVYVSIMGQLLHCACLVVVRFD